MENNDFQRIKRVMQVKEIPSFAEFSRLIGLSTPQNFTDLKRGKYKITRNFAAKIHDIYPDISVAWLLTGEGGMFVGDKSQFNMQDNVNVGGDNIVNSDLRLVRIVESQQETIREQAATINKLTSLLTTK